MSSLVTCFSAGGTKRCARTAVLSWRRNRMRTSRSTSESAATARSRISTSSLPSSVPDHRTISPDLLRTFAVSFPPRMRDCQVSRRSPLPRMRVWPVRSACTMSSLTPACSRRSAISRVTFSPRCTITSPAATSTPPKVTRSLPLSPASVW